MKFAPEVLKRSKRLKQKRQELRRRDLNAIASLCGGQSEIMWQSDAESDREEEIHELATIVADTVDLNVGRPVW